MDMDSKSKIRMLSTFNYKYIITATGRRTVPKQKQTHHSQHTHSYQSACSLSTNASPLRLMNGPRARTSKKTCKHTAQVCIDEEFNATASEMLNSQSVLLPASHSYCESLHSSNKAFALFCASIGSVWFTFNASTGRRNIYSSGSYKLILDVTPTRQCRLPTRHFPPFRAHRFTFRADVR